jgi:tetratricopeptide (TPR) repeat protein
MTKHFFIVLLAVAVLSTVAYHHVHRNWILFRKGENFFARKEFSKAIPYYQKALKEGLDKPELIAHLAHSHLISGNIEESRQLYKKMLSEQPGNLPALYALASVSSLCGQFDEATRLYREILKRDMKNYAARIQLARVLAWNGHFQEAIDEYKKALGESA